MLYTEQTPNPESLNFVTNRMLFPQKQADLSDQAFAEQWSPIAKALYEKPFVKGVFIANNFVTVTKEFNYQWEDIMLDLKKFIKDYIDNGGEILLEGYEEAKAALDAEKSETYVGETGEIVSKIKELIDTYVKPAVEMDGGNIEFQSYNDGIVKVLLQGSCSGCPSSTVTLKAGIEGMLKRMVPEVKEVVSEMG